MVAISGCVNRARPGVNIAEGELNQIAGEIGGDIPQAVDDSFPPLPSTR